jgi:hypothetical protein
MTFTSDPPLVDVSAPVFKNQTAIDYVGLDASDLPFPSDNGDTALVTNQDNYATFFTATPFDVDSAEFQHQHNVNDSRGMLVSDDGVNYYVVDNQNETVQYYSLSTPFDISTRSFEFTLTNIISGGNRLWDIDVASNGSLFFVSGNSGSFNSAQGFINRIAKYSLSTPHDLSTATLQSEVDLIPNSDPRHRGIEFRNSGATLITNTGGGLQKYSFATPFDLTTASLDDSVGVQFFDRSYGLSISPNGQFVFTTTRDNDGIIRTELNSPLDITDIKEVKLYNSFTGDTPSGIYVNPDGTMLLESGGQSDIVRQADFVDKWLLD